MRLRSSALSRNNTEDGVRFNDTNYIPQRTTPYMRLYTTNSSVLDYTKYPPAHVLSAGISEVAQPDGLFLHTQGVLRTAESESRDTEIASDQ